MSDDEFVNPSRDMKIAYHFMDASEKKQLAIHQVFKNAKEFNEVLRDYAIKKGFELLKVKNAKDRITTKCRVEGCLFRVHASLTLDVLCFSLKH